MERFGKRLAAIRCCRGMSPYELAAAVGTAANTIYRYERGETVPTTYNLIRICDALNVSADVMIGRREMTEEEKPSFSPKI